VMKPVEEKIAKVSRRGSCRMIRNKCQMRWYEGWHFREKTQLTHVHVGHVMFGDHLIFGRPFVKQAHDTRSTKIGRYCRLTLSGDKNRSRVIEKSADFCRPTKKYRPYMLENRRFCRGESCSVIGQRIVYRDGGRVDGCADHEINRIL